jgi:hypothetical protein
VLALIASMMRSLVGVPFHAALAIVVGVARGDQDDEQRRYTLRVCRLLAATHDDFFPLTTVIALLGDARVRDLLRARGGELLRFLGVDFVFVVVFHLGGALEIFDASPERIADSGKLVSPEDDENDEQDDD